MNSNINLNLASAPFASSMPTAVSVVNNELAIAWNDGTEQYLSLRALREACPCAVCEGEPDVMGNKVAVGKNFTAESFILKKYEFVGGYALQFFWGDGHSSGIYSFDFLHNSTAAANCCVAPVLASSSASCTLPVCALETPYTSLASASSARSLFQYLKKLEFFPNSTTAAEVHPDHWK